MPASSPTRKTLISLSATITPSIRVGTGVWVVRDPQPADQRSEMGQERRQGRFPLGPWAEVLWVRGER